MSKTFDDLINELESDDNTSSTRTVKTQPVSEVSNLAQTYLESFDKFTVQSCGLDTVLDRLPVSEVVSSLGEKYNISRKYLYAFHTVLELVYYIENFDQITDSIALDNFLEAVTKCYYKTSNRNKLVFLCRLGVPVQDNLLYIYKDFCGILYYATAHHETSISIINLRRLCMKIMHILSQLNIETDKINRSDIIFEDFTEILKDIYDQYGSNILMDVIANRVDRLLRNFYAYRAIPTTESV